MSAWIRFQPSPRDSDWPTLFHITHYKAGSQWIHKILTWLAPERVVLPQYGSMQFLSDPIQPGMIYPTVYVTREEFDAVSIPSNSRRFVVIRDLRDTLVSQYFSLLFSHEVDDVVRLVRPELQTLSREEGLLWLVRHPTFWVIAELQRSWVMSGEPVVKYEDLLNDDEAVLRRVLLDECKLPVSEQHLRNAVEGCRFQAVTGRERGREDMLAHERKGIAGDWRNHFNDAIDRAFNEQYGAVLEAAGYRAGV